MRTLQKYLLEFDQAKAFVEEQLEGFNEFSEVVLRSFNFENGYFYTLLPEYADMAHLYQFKLMGILPSNPIEEIYIDGLGTFEGEWVNSIDEEMSLYLLEMMQCNKNLFLIFDDILQSPSDPHVELFHSNGISFQNEICYVVNQITLSLELIKKCIKESQTAWHALFIASEANFNNIKNKKLSANNIQEICDFAKVLLVVAYDGEGYVLWEKYPNK